MKQIYRLLQVRKNKAFNVILQLVECEVTIQIDAVCGIHSCKYN